MALSKEELDQIVAGVAAQLTAGGVTAQVAPAPAPDIFESMPTPVETLLDQLRLNPGPNEINTVESWLVDQGYEEAVKTPEEEAAEEAQAAEELPAHPEYAKFLKWLEGDGHKEGNDVPQAPAHAAPTAGGIPGIGTPTA